MHAKCGHTTEGNLGLLVCDKPKGHKGWHEQTTKLRGRIESTNWGNDGLAMHASKEPNAK